MAGAVGQPAVPAVVPRPWQLSRSWCCLVWLPTPPQVWSDVGMFQGLLIFAIGGVLLVVAYLVILDRRKQYQETVPPEELLTDEEFRKFEYGDDL